MNRLIVFCKFQRAGGGRVKDDRGPRMKLQRRPVEPTPMQLDAVARRVPRPKEQLHQTWMDFLYWDSALEL